MSPALTVGLTRFVDDADLILMLPGITAGYSLPVGASEQARKNRGAYVGLVIGAYVPLFDLN